MAPAPVRPYPGYRIKLFLLFEMTISHMGRGRDITTSYKRLFITTIVKSTERVVKTQLRSLGARFFRTPLQEHVGSVHPFLLHVSVDAARVVVPQYAT